MAKIWLVFANYKLDYGIKIANNLTFEEIKGKICIVTAN